MLILQHITYFHGNRDLLFNDINLNIPKHSKSALIGNNGSGKSTLLKIMNGHLEPASGLVRSGTKPFYVPQIFGQFNDLTVAQALQIDTKLIALQEILDGNITEQNLDLLGDAWNISEQCSEALAQWGLSDVHPDQKMSTLSGGQKTCVFLAGITIHKPEIVLLDEPSNHLDAPGRKRLYEYIRITNQTLVVVSHDKRLLNLLDQTFELSARGISLYGGNYDFYSQQKSIEINALEQDLTNTEKSLRRARTIEKESVERQRKLDARGKAKQEKAGLPRISMNTFRNNAENSTSRTKNVLTERVGQIAQQLTTLRKDLPVLDKMKMNLDNSFLHVGKVLMTATDLDFGYGGHSLWKQPLNFQIHSGERVAISGCNGSGKTTLINLILGKLAPLSGSIHFSDSRFIYFDQDYSLINDGLTVYEQAEQFNSGALAEHDVKIRLNRFLFQKNDWDKYCKDLSGGEKMRLILCSLTISTAAPDLIILDEPTNNLDIQNTEILTQAINEYSGTILVISHDTHFLQEINVGKMIHLESA